MRLFPLVLLSFGALVACTNSHGSPPDSDVRADSATDAPADGGPDAMCGDRPPSFACRVSCDSGIEVEPLCDRPGWVCPPGSVDASSCCAGARPAPDCLCDGSEWLCEEGCPDGINPWDPSNPANACSVEGATCSEGSQCGSAMFCQCEGGAWNCAVAEPDPVCTCGREPSAGDPCVEEGASCGECCPGPGSWEPLACVDGRWEQLACPDIECPMVPESECPVYSPEIIGTLCPSPGQSCGDACCGTAIDCADDSRWRPGPDADCLCAPGIECGDGTCPRHQLCHQSCGLVGGPIYSCAPRPADGCADCSCIVLGRGQGCEMRDGAPFIYDFCA